MNGLGADLNRLKLRRAREALEKARSSEAVVECPCCGAHLLVECCDDQVMVYCGSCLFTASDNTCRE